MDEAKKILKNNNLRPTIQRVAMVDYIIKKHKVHITAAKLMAYLKYKNINFDTSNLFSGTYIIKIKLINENILENKIVIK